MNKLTRAMILASAIASLVMLTSACGPKSSNSHPVVAIASSSAVAADAQAIEQQINTCLSENPTSIRKTYDCVKANYASLTTEKLLTCGSSVFNSDNIALSDVLGSGSTASPNTARSQFIQDFTQRCVIDVNPSAAPSSVDSASATPTK